MDKKVIDIIGGEAVVYYEGGNFETVAIMLPSNSIKIGGSMKGSNTLTSCSHIRENPLMQREMHFY